METPPRLIKKGAVAILFPGLKADYASERSSGPSGERSNAGSSADEARQESAEEQHEEESEEPGEVPGQEPGEEQGQEKTDMSKVNSRSRKKQWNKIARYVKSNPDACPTISRLWNGTPQERDGVWPKVESELSRSASVGTESRSRRALLTVKQTREAPHFSPPEKIRAIVATRTPVKDEDTPHFTNKYWCMVTVTADEYNKSEPGP